MPGPIGAVVRPANSGLTGERGTVTIHALLFSVTFVGVALLLIAVATALVLAAAKAQAAADAAALAGAAAAPVVGGDGRACWAARRVSWANGASLSSCRASADAWPFRVEVTVQIGLSLPASQKAPMHAQAAAAVRPPPAAQVRGHDR